MTTRRLRTRCLQQPTRLGAASAPLLPGRAEVTVRRRLATGPSGVACRASSPAKRQVCCHSAKHWEMLNCSAVPIWASRHICCYREMHAAMHGCRQQWAAAKLTCRLGRQSWLISHQGDIHVLNRNLFFQKADTSRAAQLRRAHALKWCLPATLLHNCLLHSSRPPFSVTLPIACSRAAPYPSPAPHSWSLASSWHLSPCLDLRPLFAGSLAAW